MSGAIGLRRMLAAFALMALTAEKYVADPLGNTVLPPSTPVVPGTEVDLAPREVVLKSPVGFRAAMVLDRDVEISIGKTSVRFTKGTALGAARIGVYNSDKEPWAGFCPTAPQVQMCLIDTDGDGQVDHAILLNAKKADAEPVAIAPMPINLQRNVPLPDPSFAVIRYGGRRPIDGRPVFWLFIVENGREIPFNNGYASISVQDLPKEINIFGAVFTLKAYDPDTHHVRLILHRDIRPAPYSFTARTSTTFIPVFIPRR